MIESIHPELVRTQRQYDVEGAPVISTTIGPARRITPLRLDVVRWRDAVPGRSDTVRMTLAGWTLRKNGTRGAWRTISVPEGAPYPQWLKAAIERGELDD